MVDRMSKLGRVVKEMSLDSADPDPDPDGGVGATTAPVTTAPVGGKRNPRRTAGPPGVGGQHGGTPVNYRGKEDSWR